MFQAIRSPAAHSKEIARFLSVAAALVSLSGAASASDFTAEVLNWDTTIGACGSVLDDSNPSLVAIDSIPFTGGQGIVQSSGRPGLIASSFAFTISPNPPPNPTGSLFACTRTSMQVDDVVIVGPGDTVDVGVTLQLFGGGVTTVRSALTLEAQLQVAGTAPDGTLVSSPKVVSGSLASLSTPLITVRTDQPIALIARFDSQASMLPDLNPSTFDTTHAFGYDTGAPVQTPVFDLPPGYTTYSIEGNILDNVYVPESRLGSGLASGVASLLMSARVRRRRVSESIE